jgi:hypothetical protein
MTVLWKYLHNRLTIMLYLKYTKEIYYNLLIILIIMIMIFMDCIIGGIDGGIDGGSYQYP